jgi:hypothetical protein
MTEFKQCSIVLTGEENFNITIGDKIFTTKEVMSKMKESKMTREEAIKKVKLVVSLSHPEKSSDIVNALEALGLIKFEEPKEIYKLCSAEKANGITPGYNFKIEEWPEGFVFWANGEIVWKSWKP